MEHPREEVQGPSPEDSVNQDITVGNITDVYERWASQRIGRDARLVRISEALAANLRSLPALADIAQEMIDFHSLSVPGRFQTHPGALIETSPAHTVGARRSRMPYPEYAANLLMRGFWHQWRTNGLEPGWPEDFIQRDVCNKAILSVLDDPAQVAELETNINFRPVQSTVPSRAVGPKIVMLAYGDRFERPSLVSIGHSLGLSEKKLLLNEELPAVRLMDWHGQEKLLADKPAQSYFVNKALNLPLQLSGCAAMDILPGDNDPASKEWALSSFTPREQMDKNFMADATRLASTLPPNYSSLAGDFTLPGQEMRLVEKLESNKAEIVLFSTIWYQLGNEERVAMLKNALNILSDDGLIILQDFVQTSQAAYQPESKSLEEAVSKLYFPNEWGPWTYRTLVMDPSNTGYDFKEVAYFKDGRCSQMVLSKALKLPFLV